MMEIGSELAARQQADGHPGRLLRDFGDSYNLKGYYSLDIVGKPGDQDQITAAKLRLTRRDCHLDP
jgi:hypothetical protein